MMNLKSLTLLTAAWLLLAGCQSSPYSRGEDPNVYVANVMQTLRQLAASEYTPPSENEAGLVHNALNALMATEDTRFYPLVLLLKENKVELAVIDAERMAASPEASKDFAFAKQARYFSAALRTFLRPRLALTQLQQGSQDHPELLPADWKLLQGFLQQRLASSSNQIFLLKKSLFTAEAEGNVAEQIRLHEQILQLINGQGAEADLKAMTYHLNRLIALTPGNHARRLGQWQSLAELYRRTGDDALAESANRQALETAKAINDKVAVARLQELLGIHPVNPEWIAFSAREHQRIADLLRAMKEIPDSNQSGNQLALVESYFRVGETNLAQSQAVLALSQARSEQNPQSESTAIRYLADLARIAGDLRRAQSQYTLASGLIANAAVVNPDHYLLPINAAMMAFFQGQIDVAVGQLNSVITEAANNHQPLFVARAQLARFMIAAMQAKQFNAQADGWRQPLAVLQQLDPSGAQEEDVMSEAGVVLSGLSQYREAIKAYDRAIELAAKQQHYFPMARYRTNKALAMQRLGQRDEAMKELRDVETLLTTLQSDMLASVQNLIASLPGKTE